MSDATESRRVGPVLRRGALCEAVLAAIREENQEVEVIDRGSYVRVLVPRRCLVTRGAVERHWHGPFLLPSDLEIIMPSFAGRFFISSDEARWEAES